MSEHALVRHASASLPVAGLELFAAAKIEGAAALRLSYRLRGDLTRVALAPHGPSQRADGLWEHTCFEAFVAPAGGERYFELNVAPSTEWAAYVFDGYRTGMRPLDFARPPAIVVERGPGELCVTADVDLSTLGPAPWPWHIGLFAVVAEVAGARSYWALRHAGAKPDFHDVQGFTLRLEGIAR